MSMPLRVALVLLLLAGLAFAPDGTYAQAPATVAIDPPEQQVEPESGPFEVAVTVADLQHPQGIGGYTLVVQYDPDVLRAVSVTDAGFVASTGNAVVCPSSAIDNDEGRLGHLCLTISIFGDAGPQAAEPEVLARVIFEPAGEGATTLGLEETTVLTPEGDAMDVELAGGSVVVGAGDAPAGATPVDAGAEPAADEDDDDGGDNVGLYIGIGVGIAVVVVAAGALLLRWRGAGRNA